MNELWLDTNILVRLITREPPDQAEQALRLVRQAEQGEVILRLLPLVVAEVIWVLGSFYEYRRPQIAEVLVPFLTRPGLILEDADLTIAAIDVMAEANVDFLDAFLAETVRRQGGTVVSFDRDFRRLNANWVEPE